MEYRVQGYRFRIRESIQTQRIASWIWDVKYGIKISIFPFLFCCELSRCLSVILFGAKSCFSMSLCGRSASFVSKLNLVHCALYDRQKFMASRGHHICFMWKLLIKELINIYNLFFYNRQSCFLFFLWRQEEMFIHIRQSTISSVKCKPVFWV